MRTVHITIVGCALLFVRLPIGAQGPVHPDLSGVWTFVRNPSAATNAGAVFGDRFTIEQSTEAVVITRTMMVRRIPGASGLEAMHFRYPFNESESPGPNGGCPVSRTGWDGPSLIIVTTYPDAAGCAAPIAQEIKDGLHLDSDGGLTVERTVIVRYEMRNHVLRPAGRVGPDENPPVVTTAHYKKAGLIPSD
jgi:hypothetical protein